MYIDLSALSPDQIYYTMTQTVIPRPVAWVLSENENRSFNLAPFSYFTPISSRPPLVMMSVGKKPDGSYKDTRVNIEARGHYVIHIAHEELAGSVTETSRTLPAGESELDRVELETVNFAGFSLPRLSVCRIALACELYSLQEMGDVPQSLIFGCVKQLYISDAVAQRDEKDRLLVDAAKVRPIGRLGGNEYASFGDVINIPRPR
jgi:flavin reductase (DIM6/NTAB) family NADH-FMN oxidoreductase RutF